MGQVMMVDRVGDIQIRPPLIFPSEARFTDIELLFYLGRRNELNCYLSYTCTVTEKWDRLVALYKAWYAQWNPRFEQRTKQGVREGLLVLTEKGTNLPGEMLILLSERMPPEKARRLGIPSASGRPWINAGIELREQAKKLEAKVRGQYAQFVAFRAALPRLASL